MASTKAVSSDISSSRGGRPRFRYQVFLSFRGDDTRKTFTSHLCAAFSRAGVSTFLDDNVLPRGEDIQSEIRSAIQQSQSSVIVFSKNYAFSRWCLDELVMILERRRMFGQVVLPVFYDVDPSHLRNQTGRVAEAFCRHERNQSARHKVEGWRKALAEVADLAGMVLQNQAYGHEAKFIEKILKVMDDKLSRMPLSVAPDPIGNHSLVENINFWLRNGSTEVGMLGIYGMRGIGKTTIAEFLFTSNRTEFGASSFLQNISRSSRTPSGLIEMQQKLLFDLTEVKKGRIHTIEEGRRKIEGAINSTRVLLVLDDVDHADQLDAIFMMKSQFCAGSKVIITTNNAGLLRGTRHKHIGLHTIQPLGDNDSLKLFSWYAFGQDYPNEDYMDCSKKVVEICGGLPLALKVLGSSLSGRSMVVWESSLKKLQHIPNGEITNKLRISYESLQDAYDQNVFLHIACFFVGMDKDDVVRILDSCGNFYTDIGIENIIERCLVTIDRDNKVQMHYLIQSMGREIVRSESKDPNKLTRLLWHPNDSLKVLKEKKDIDTQSIEGLNLDMEMVQVDPAYDRPRNSNGEVSLKTDEFSRMHKLRLLKIGHVQLNGSYGDTFPTELRWLCWNQSSFDSLPNDFPLKSMVVLEMCYSRLKLLWRHTQYLPSLKTLNLSYSDNLTKSPDFSHTPNLESLILKGCTNLVDLHESVGNLERLAHLNIEDCKKIRKLPHCKSLKTFQADGVPIPQLLTTVEVLSCLLSQSLMKLSLVNCNLSDAHFPKGVGLSALRNVNLSSNPITCLPDFIRNAPRLDHLTLRQCELLTSLIRIPPTRVLDVTKSTLLERITGQSLMSALQGISWSSNRNLVEFETWFKLEPIENVRQEVTEIFGPFNLQPTDTVVISAGVPTVWWERKTLPIQVLHEHGYVSTFLPGNNDITNDFMSYTRTTGSSISFAIPSRPNQSFQALNIFCLYGAVSNFDTPRTSIDDLKDGFPQPLMATISNKRMGKKWWYAPMFFGVPSRHNCGGDNILWLCHWNLENHLNGGDRVTVSVFTGSELEVKECGIKLLYQEDVVHFSTKNVPEYWGMSFEKLDINYMCWSTLALEYNDFSKRDWFKYLMQHSDDDHREIPDEEELQVEATVESMIDESTTDEEREEGDKMIEHEEKKEASVPGREFGSIEDCMEALEAMEGVDDEAYLKACEKFVQSANMRKVFVKMSEGRRRAWLNSLKKIRSTQ